MIHPLSHALACVLQARGVAFLTLASLALPGAAWAVEADAADTDADAEREPVSATLDTVVVSAQKRETNLQETPISVSVLDATALNDRHAISLGSLADGSIPSLRIAPYGTRSSALTLGIRGIGVSGDANQPARDTGVGVYVDGVFLGRAQGLGTALYDVERIEVLKGPQGTLFGRNTEGGAISIVTRQPTGEFGLRTTAGVSNYGGHNSAIHLDLPRVGDVSFKIDGLETSRGGTTDNPMRGEKDFNAYDKRGLRLTALWQPRDGFEATYAYDNSYDATTPYHAQLVVAGDSVSPLQRAGVQDSRRDTSILGGPQEDSVGKTEGHLLTMGWKLADNLELKSISSYRELEQSQFDMGLIDGISAFKANGEFGRYSIAHLWQHQYSQELQLVGNTDTVQFVLGAFYYKEAAADDAQTPNTARWNQDGTDYTSINLPLDLSTVTVARASKAWTDSLGIFGQATWTPEALQRLHLTAGGRWSREKKEGVLRTLDGAPSDLAFEGDWSRFDPMVNIGYDLADDVMVYARYSTGFKAGGANSRSFSYRAFAPEEVKAYELGLKSQFWSGRARLNLALFDAKIENKQMDFYLPLAPGQNRTVSDTTNAATSGKSRGAELEFAIVPVDNLTVGLNYAYTDTDAITAPNPYVDGNPLVTVLPLYAPRNAGSATLDYLVPLRASAVRFHLDGNWSDGYYTSESDQTLTDDSLVFNARVALVDVPMGTSGATAEFAVWSRNLFDEEHIFYTSSNPGVGTYGVYNDPRTFGVEVSLNF